MHSKGHAKNGPCVWGRKTHGLGSDEDLVTMVPSINAVKTTILDVIHV